MRQADGALQSLSYKNRRQRNIVVGVSVLALVVFVFLLIAFVRNKNLNKKNDALFNHNEKILKEYDEKLKIIESYEQKLSQKDYSEPAEGMNTEVADSNKKYRNSNLSEEMLDDIICRVADVMKNGDEICSDSFSLDRLATLIGWKKNYISQALNERLKQNFNSLLAESRVKIVCQKLRSDNRFADLSVEAIAEGSGFKSRSNFSVVFKKVMGVSPSEYVKIIKSTSHK